ncbi:hypothetical protein [Methanolobus profundi]
MSNSSASSGGAISSRTGMTSFKCIKNG